VIYTDIKTSALVYADRVGDAELTSARLDSFLRIVEARINRSLNTQPMNLSVIIPSVPDQLSYQLPDGWLIVRNVVRRDASATSGTVLASINLEQMNNARTNKSSNSYYYITESSLHVHPLLADTEVLDIAYTSRLVPLSSINIENPIAKYNPDCYIFGLLVEISSFVKDTTAIQFWDTRFKEALNEISAQDMSATWAGVPLQVRLG